MIEARLRWNGDQPFSRQFGDIYHAADGAAEVQRVFVDPQRLIERFHARQGTFTIGELGFGTGLNFAVIAHHYLTRSPASARLHFISVEKYPVGYRDFEQLARRRQHDLPIYAELMREYPPSLPGWHRRHMAAGRITLSVFFGDADDGLTDIVSRQRVPIDAWLLDGFAPDRNPELWRDGLWRTMANLSATGTTVATFSAVGAVRRALSAAGFAIRRVDQRPHKRHSLAGTFNAKGQGDFTPPRSVIVIGAGLAGAATARRLSERGVRVSLLDTSTAPPNRMAATLFHCRMSSNSTQASAVRWLSYLYSNRFYSACATASTDPPPGVLQVPSHSLTPRRLERIADRYSDAGRWIRLVDAATASSLAGIPLQHSGLFFPHGRVLNLSNVCDDLMQHPLIDYRCGVTASAVATDADRATATTNAGTLTCDRIVLCTGAATNAFDQARYLELLPIWGQIDRITLDSPPDVPLVGEGFLIPLGSVCGIGATYEHAPWVNGRASEFNLRRFEAWWRVMSGTDTTQSTSTDDSTLRGTRAVTSDRAPIVGALFDPVGAPVPRLLVNTGHGSQGTVSAPFAAECVASESIGEFAPCTRAEYQTLSSIRFRTRQARRGPRHGAAD